MEIIKRSFGYLQKYLKQVLGAFVMMLIVTVCSLLVPQFIEQIIDEGITAQNLNIIQRIAGILIGITIIRAFASFFETFWSQTASQGIAFDMRNQIFTKLEYLNFSFHDQHHIGQLLTRTTNDVEGVRSFFATGILQIFSALLTLVGSIIILLNTNWKLFLMVAIVLPIIVFIFISMFRKLTPIFGRIQRNIGKLNNILQENILGVRIVKGFTAERIEHQRYSTQNEVIYRDNLAMIRAFSNGFPYIFFLSNIATLIVLLFGGKQVIGDEMSIGTLIAFNSYLAFLVQPIFQLGFVLQQFARASASASRIFSILDTPNEIESPSEGIHYDTQSAPSISFEGVSFSYTQDVEECSLRNINLEIEAGSNVAIIGKTGSGKSTLVSLIPRFYDPLEGVVCINGQDVMDYDLESLRQHVGVVLQEIRLLNDSIRANVIYGKPDATEDEIAKVCKIAQVDTFLDKYENGIEFQVGEGGKNLSGGQRQRVAIARMLLASPKILILDDATSALDGATEHNLIKEAQPYLQSSNHTVIVISQKMDTIRQVDHIVVMDGGRIVGQGNHAYLQKHSATYRALINQETNEPATSL